MKPIRILFDIQKTSWFGEPLPVRAPCCDRSGSQPQYW